MTLAELITALEAADPAQVVAHGFRNPHSYRGDYMDLAFEPASDVTVADMLADARSALGATFEGYKGGDFTMSGYTDCWLAEYGCLGETLGPLLVQLMLAVPAAVSPPPATRADDRAALAEKLWQIAEHHIVAEWICCEPLEPRHELCAKGYAALGMARTLLVDSDPEKAWNPAAPVLDAVLAELAAARADALREAADRYAKLADQNEAYDREQGDLDEEARLQHGTVRDVAAGLRRMADEEQQPETVTVRELAHAIDNSTPYPIEIRSEVCRFVAQRLLEMLTIVKRPEHAVWQPEEEPPPGPQPLPEDPSSLADEETSRG